ncbi:MAG: glycoside hydrolase, partial [Treponema sp.]|nr:glycoside hydrolase [Treponema sp.]
MGKKTFFLFIISFLLCSGLFSQNEEVIESEKMPVPFREIWGYVMIGEESSFSKEFPVTDIGYFVNAVNNFSDFVPVPKRNERFPDFNGRIHIVSSVDSRAQTHLLLDPKLKLRNKIISQLVEQTKEYDGLQIDWELVVKEDDENFRTFLKILKRKLKGKMLTVAIPARVKTLERDAYDYKELSKIVDKIIVMAYDEHWST